MKTRILGTLAVLAIAVIAAFPLRSALSHAAPSPRPAVAAPVAAAAPAPPAEPHPEIRGALASLRQAGQRLQHGAHDFGGHRARALQLTDQAIQECRAALAYDRH